jgi:hypothetical protein
MVPLRNVDSACWCTGFISEQWTEPLAIHSQSQGLIDPRGIAVSTLARLTPWAWAKCSHAVGAISSHFQISDGEIDAHGDFEGSLEVKVLVIIEVLHIPSAIDDFFEFFEETPGQPPQLGDHDQGFSRFLPSFLCFAAIPVASRDAPSYPVAPLITEVGHTFLNF